MAKQTLNPTQLLIEHMSTQYSTFQVKSGAVSVNINSGETDYTVDLTTAFPNGVLWGQISWGGISTNWTNYLPRAQNSFTQSGGRLYVTIHVVGGVSQSLQIHYSAFGY